MNRNPSCGICNSVLRVPYKPKHTAHIWECPTCLIEPYVITYSYFPTSYGSDKPFKTFMPVGEFHNILADAKKQEVLGKFKTPLEVIDFMEKRLSLLN